MNNLRKIAAAGLSVALSASMIGCTPAIGAGSKTAMSVDGYDVPAGLFIYYTLQGYNEAASHLQQKNGTEPSVDDVKSTNIEDTDSTDWIQNKATKYCKDFVAVQREFELIGGELTSEEKDEAAQMAEYYYAQYPTYADNGISLDTMKLMAESSYKEQKIFDHYYGFEGEKGCSEDELKEYFNDNFARVKYVSISLLDGEGNKVSEDKERNLRKKADEYAAQINDKAREIDKMLEVNNVQSDYDEYVEAQNTTLAQPTVEEETTTTAVEETTTESTESTTTTTDKYDGERIIQKNTTTTASADSSDDTETTSAEEEDSEYKFKEFIFNELTLDKATVYDYDGSTIYVVIRGDLHERMTEEDYWNADYISYLQSMRYTDDFKEYLEEKADALSLEKNKSAYRRYAPFKLKLEDNSK
ncbi:MAG: hypothetical protein IKP78_07495 [Ruminococcus sp.]|nr:hypothetical protein [Ruminococcus sp.]